jgi:probable HAF family extracellular repeat protein
MSFGRVGQLAFVWRSGKMQPLPSLGGLTYANAIANNGDVAGEVDGAHDASHHAILWHDGKLVDLGSLGGRLNRAIALNEHGQVVGNSSTASEDLHAFLWQNGTMTDLGTLGGPQSQAVAINDVGQVIGTSTTASGAQHAFIWQNGKMTDLGSFPNDNSTPTAIDAKGNVVGFTNPGIYDPNHAVVWRNGKQLQDLGNFGSKVKQAIAIDSAGQILVSTFRPDTHAFLWKNDHSVEIGRRYTAAHGINDRGWVVGTALFRKKGPQVPFVWQGGRMTALPTLDGTGPPTSAAYQINDNGWIVGRSYAAAGDRAVVWTSN